MPAISAVYPPEIWARESLLVLQDNHVMANLVHRNFEDEVAQYGDVVNTRKPDKFTVNSIANSVGSSVTVANATATNVPVTLNNHEYVAFGITSRDQATSIKNLVEEFMEPAMIPMADSIDTALLDPTDGLTSESLITTSQSCLSNVFEKTTLAGVQKKLLDNQVPFNPVSGTSRVSLVLNTQHHADLMVQDEILRADTSGTNPPAIRTGFIGSLFGMNVYVSQNVPTLSTTTEFQSVAFHRNALALITRPLESVGSEYGVRSAVVSKDGVGLRVMMSYDHLKLQWTVTADILYGYKMLDALLACRVTES